MARQQITSISEYPLPDSLSTEIQVIADIISLPETFVEAKRVITPEMFTDEKCRNAYLALCSMANEGMVIDLPSAYGRIDRELMQKGVVPMLQNSGTTLTVTQHYHTLKTFDIRRKCYFEAMRILASACNSNSTAQDLVGLTSSFADNLRKDIGTHKEFQHISEVLIEVGEHLEGLQIERQKGNQLRVPTGFGSLNYYTYGGFNAGNLVILAARPSVGKTAVMLQMAKAAAESGKTANIFSLEMTNSELVQRLILSEDGAMNQWKMARGDIEWSSFEVVTGRLSSKPIYLNDTARTYEEISALVSMNAMTGKCDIAFIDYLGLIKLNKNANLSQAISEVTNELKALAKSCKIPIVLLCQLNRSSASEKRAPELHDLRDSGSIEQDADIVLMLERAPNSEDEKDVNMWLRKNRQGEKNVCIEIRANDSFSAFTERGGYAPPIPDDIPPSSNEFLDSQFPF